MGKKLNIFMGLCAYLLATAPYAWAQFCDYEAFLADPVGRSQFVVRSVSKGRIKYDDVPDVAQEVAIRVLQGNYDPNRPFGTWVYRIAANEIFRHLEREIRKSSKDGPVMSEVFKESSPDTYLASKPERFTEASIHSKEVEKLRTLAADHLRAEAFPDGVVAATRLRMLMGRLANHDFEGKNVREDKKTAALLKPHTLDAYQLWERGKSLREISSELEISSKTTSDVVGFFRKKVADSAMSQMDALSAKEAKFYTDNWHQKDALKKLLWDNDFSGINAFYELRALTNKILETELNHRPVGMRVPRAAAPPIPWSTERQVILEYINGTNKRSIGRKLSLHGRVVEQTLSDFFTLLFDRAGARGIQLSHSDFTQLISVVHHWDEVGSLFASRNSGIQKIEALELAARRLVSKAELGASGKKIFSVTISVKNAKNLDQAILKTLLSGGKVSDVPKALKMRPHLINNRVENLKEYIIFEANLRGIQLETIPGYRSDLSIEELVSVVLNYKKFLQVRVQGALVLRASLSEEPSEKIAARLGIDLNTYHHHLYSRRKKLRNLAEEAGLISPNTSPSAIPWDIIFPYGIPQ